MNESYLSYCIPLPMFSLWSHNVSFQGVPKNCREILRTLFVIFLLFSMERSPPHFTPPAPHLCLYHQHQFSKLGDSDGDGEYNDWCKFCNSIHSQGSVLLGMIINSFELCLLHIIKGESSLYIPKFIMREPSNQKSSQSHPFQGNNIAPISGVVSPLKYFSSNQKPLETAMMEYLPL